MRKLAWAIIGAVILICGVGGFLGYRQFQSQSKAGQKNDTVTVERGDVEVVVVESGTLDAVKSVDVRSRASGRLQRMLVGEGASVTAGDLIAVIDPQETQLQVDQNQATLRGAVLSVQRTDIELQQRQVAAQAALESALSRLQQAQKEAALQPTITQAAISQAEAALAAAATERDRLVQVVLPNDRTATERELQNAENAYETAKREYERTLELEKSGFVATRTLDSAKLEMETAARRLQAARLAAERMPSDHRQQLARAEWAIRQAEAELTRALASRIQDESKAREVEQARAAVAQAQAALRDVEVLITAKAEGQTTVDRLQSALSDAVRQLGETQIRAPMDGVVAKRYLEIGDLVTGLSGFSQGTAIVRIEDRRSMRVLLTVNEIDVARMKEGMSAEVTIDAVPDTPFRGTVRKIAPTSVALAAQTAGQSAASDNVVKYEVEIWLDSTNPVLRSGMTAQCRMVVLRRENVLRVPVEYLGKDGDGEFVMVAPDAKDPKAEPQRTAVEVGARTGRYAEILGGVTEGTRLSRPPFTGPQRMGVFQTGPPE
ncbi:MAG: HlyD family efflux transporter periplasmic adaptor subunit [Fimbriimonadaceae bacterium]